MEGLDLLLVIRLLVKSCGCRHNGGGGGTLLLVGIVGIVPLKVTAALGALIKAPNRAHSSRGRRETEPSLLIVILLELEQGLKCGNLRRVFLSAFSSNGEAQWKINVPPSPKFGPTDCGRI